MLNLLTLPFIQKCGIDEDDYFSSEEGLTGQTIEKLVPYIKLLCERLGKQYKAVVPEPSDRSTILIEELENFTGSDFISFIKPQKEQTTTHIDHLHNSFRYQYIHVMYEGSKVEGNYLQFIEAKNFNQVTLEKDCAILNYGKGENGELATLKHGFTIFEAASMLVTYLPEDMPVFLLPFHPLEHFWTLSEGDTQEALINFDEWYNRFRSLFDIFSHLMLEFTVIIGHRSWLRKMPDYAELSAYTKSKSLSNYLLSEVKVSDMPKEISDQCRIISLGGAYNDQVVTIVNWYKGGMVTNTDLYYQISGPIPIDAIEAFCEKYGITALTAGCMIEESGNETIDSITQNIRRSAIL